MLNLQNLHNWTKEESELAIKEQTALIEDWASRVYKDSRLKVTDVHTEGDIYFNLSVNTVNEKRRRNRISDFKDNVSRIKDHLKFLESKKSTVVVKNNNSDIEEKSFEEILAFML